MLLERGSIRKWACLVGGFVGLFIYLFSLRSHVFELKSFIRFINWTLNDTCNHIYQQQH